MILWKKFMMGGWIFLGLSWLVQLPAWAASCTISLPGLDFGSYDPLSGSLDTSTAVVQIICSRTVSSETVRYTMTSSVGNGTSYGSRAMLKGSEKLSYNVYRNLARTQIWGDGTGGSSVITGSFTLNNSNPTRTVSATLYGGIPALQDISAGTYSDTLVATLAF